MHRNSVRIANDGGEEMPVYIEPFGDVRQVPPFSALKVTYESEVEGAIDITIVDGVIALHGWVENPYPEIVEDPPPPAIQRLYRERAAASGALA